jgi:hypothetical protein
MALPRADGHAGSPWHDRNVQASWTAIGMSSAFLEPTAPGVPTKFVLEYPVQGPQYGFYVGYDHVAFVFPDSALLDDGLLRESELIGFELGPVFPGDKPLTVEFTITEAGYYHFGFGPGPGTSILVLKNPKGGIINVASPDGGSVTHVLGPNGTTGDLHVIKHPEFGYEQFVAWIGVMFPDAIDIYMKLGIAQGALPPLTAPQALKIGETLVEFGLLDAKDVPQQLPPGPIHAPALANFNGLGTLAFSTVFLAPGQYEFAYNPLASPFALISAQTVVLQVARDSAYDDLFSTEDEIIARVEAPLGPTPLVFEVAEPGWYHLMYGPGENSSILHFMPTPALPVALSEVGGGPVPINFKLGGVNTVIWQPLCPIDERPQLTFPCKLTNEQLFHDMGIMSAVFVPIDGPDWGPTIQALGDEILGSPLCVGDCAADCNGDDVLNILDFVCFQGEWQAQSPLGDCDENGAYNILDFVCFQQEFQQGCP